MGAPAGEPDRAWAAFTLYRDLGPASRSLQEVARRRSDGAPERSLSRVKRWSRRWGWVARAQAWDRERDRQRGEDEAEAIRAMMERHAEAAREGVELAAAAIGGRDLSEASFPELVKALAVLVGVVHARVEAG